MGKLIKLLVSIIVSLVAVTLIAIVVLPLIIDPNDFKDDLIKRVKDRTGRDLTISGDLGLSVFPWVAIDIPPTTLSNADGFHADKFVAVEQVHARVKLLPLLRKELEIGTVVLDGLVLNMETTATGNTNWQAIFKGDDAVQKKEPEVIEESASGFSLNSLTVEGVDISNAQVLWDDRSTGAKYTLSPFSLKTSEITQGKPVSVDMDLDVESRQPAIKGNVTFDGVVDVEQSFSAIKLNDIAVVLDLVGETLPGGRLQSSLKTSAVIDLEQETLSTSFLKLSALGLNVNGNIQGQAIKSAERQFAGDFQVATFSPADVMRALGLTVPVTSDNTVLEKADMSTHLVLTSDTVQLSKLAMRLDDSLINGRVAVSDFAKPAINFEIGLDQIDADRYFPPTTETDAETVVKAATVPVEVPVDMLRALNVNGEIKIGLLKAYQLRSQDIKIQLSARNGKIQVHPAQAKMYEGSYRGNIQLDVRSTPKLSMDEKFSGIQVGGLLMDMMKKETITGDTEAHVKLSGTGKTLDAIKQTLNGEMGFTFKDGAIKGVDLIRLIRQAKSAIKGQNPMEKSGSDQTDFSVLSATATVKNGVVTSDDLSAKSPLLRIDGKGMVDLNQQSIDYLLTTTIVGSLEGQGGRDISDLNGLPIPIQVTGSFAQPKYKLRLDKAIKQAAGEEIRQKVDAEKAKLKEKVDKKKAELEEKVDKKKQALEDKLKDKLNDKLKGLFN